MTSRVARTGVALLLVLCGPLAPAAPCAGDDPPAASATAPGSATQPPAATDARAAPLRGASPGDQRGPGGFLARREELGELTFYAASGGQLWYYLNLYYWVPKSLVEEQGGKDLWIREEVVETVRDLRRWPKGDSIPSPAPKTTLEYWKVGASGRTATIDNHKDFWMESQDLASGRIEVSMTLQVGRLREKGADGAWRAPRPSYVLERRDYGPKVRAPAAELRFEPLPREPVNRWEYAIAFDGGAGRVTRSVWNALPVPEIRLVRSEVPPRATAPVLTDDR